MGQDASISRENYTPISERQNVMTLEEFLNNNQLDDRSKKIGTCLSQKQQELAKLLSHPTRLSIENFEQTAKEIKKYKDNIFNDTGITIFPDVDNTPKNNIYKLNKNMVLFKSNNQMNTPQSNYNRERFTYLQKRLDDINKQDNNKSVFEKYKFNTEKDKILKEMFELKHNTNEHYRPTPSISGLIPDDKIKNQQPLQQFRNTQQYKLPTPQFNQQRREYNNDYITSIQRQQNIKSMNDGYDTVDKEGFVSSGTEGASYNKSTDTITGPALFTNQILQNNTTWNDLKDNVKNKGYATDGSNSIGAGPGNNFDKSMSAHIRNMEIMKAANNEYNTPNMLKEINKNINQDISGGSSTSLYNRGNQTRGKIISLPDKAVGVLPEEFYPERSKNRNIYKTQEIIPIAGFNINEARIGENLSEIHPVLYLQRSHKRMATGAGTTGNISDHVGKIEIPEFDARIGRTGEDKMSGSRAMDVNKAEAFTLVDRGAKTGEDNFKGSFKAAEGGNYWMPKRFVY